MVPIKILEFCKDGWYVYMCTLFVLFLWYVETQLID